MNAIDKAISQLNINHHKSDFEQQIAAIEAFKLQYQHDVSYKRFVNNLDTLKADAFLKAGKYEEALVAFTKLYQAAPVANKAFMAQRTATVLLYLNREKEAVKLVLHEILVEKEPNYLLDLLFWYVTNINTDPEDLIHLKPEINKIIEHLEIITDSELPLDDQIRHLKEERMAADKRYYSLMSEFNARSEEEKKSITTKIYTRRACRLL